MTAIPITAARSPMSAGYYSKKPVVIRAWQFVKLGHSGKTNYPELVDWITREGKKCFVREPGQIIIETLEGNMTADVGDWIIQGIKGEFYPCKPDIFEASYQEERGYPYDRPEKKP